RCASCTCQATGMLPSYSTAFWTQVWRTFRSPFRRVRCYRECVKCSTPLPRAIRHRVGKPPSLCDRKRPCPWPSRFSASTSPTLSEYTGGHAHQASKVTVQLTLVAVPHRRSRLDGRHARAQEVLRLQD